MNETPKGSPSWKDQSTKLISKFPVLTKGDCECKEGEKDQMMSKIQKKIGKTKSELETIISKL
jgi:hypothetical protein